MSRLRAFGAFWYDFIIGDDWRIALGVILGLTATAIVVHAVRWPAWWLLPAVVIVMLTVSVLTRQHAPLRLKAKKPPPGRR